MKSRAAKISSAAQAFMDAAEAAPPLPNNLSYPELRKLTREAYATAAKEAVIEHRIVLKEIEVAGIPCLRVSPPKVDQSRVMIYTYGGGFCVGSPFEDLPISSSLAHALNCVVICPNYRLAPEHPFPAALDDVETVATEIMKGDEQILLAGESAGGNLSLALLHRLNQKNLP